MQPPNLTEAHAALAHAKGVASRYKGTAPHDPARRAALERADRRLAEAGGALTPYCRRGGFIGRGRVSRDPVRQTRCEITAARKRIRSALNRTSGAPRPITAPVTVDAMWGHVG